jgi:WD40 repeat protein
MSRDKERFLCFWSVALAVFLIFGSLFGCGGDSSDKKGTTTPQNGKMQIRYVNHDDNIISPKYAVDNGAWQDFGPVNPGATRELEISVTPGSHDVLSSYTDPDTNETEIKGPVTHFVFDGQTAVWEFTITLHKPFAPWQGLIALRQSTGSLAANLWYFTADNVPRLVTDNAYWYGQIRWSPDGSLLSFPKAILTYGLADRNGMIVRELPQVAGSEVIAWSSDSKYFLASSYFSGIWKLNVDGTYSKLLTSASRTYDHAVTISKDGQWVYFVHHEWGTECTFYRIAMSKLLLGASYADCERLLYDTTGWDEEVQFAELPNTLFAVGYGNDGVIYLMDPEAKTMTKKLDLDYFSFRLSPGGKYLAAAYYLQISIIDPVSWEIVYTINTSSVTESISWSPDGDALAIADFQGAIYLWRLNDQRLQKIHDPATAQAASTGGITPKAAYGDQMISIDWTR